MGELITELEEYSIYKVENEIVSYYLCIPSNNMISCQIYLGFNDKDLNNISNDDLISMIRGVNDKILKINNNSVYIVPNVDVSILNELANINDTKDYMRFADSKIHPIIYEVSQMLVKNGMKKKNINQDIIIITRNDTDKKIAGGLSLCPTIGNFMKEVNYSQLDVGVVRIDIDDEVLIEGVDNSIQENEMVFDSGIAPIDRTHENVDTHNKENRLVRVKKKTDTSPGFSSFKLIIATLLFSLVVGILIVYLVIR